MLLELSPLEVGQNWQNEIFTIFRRQYLKMYSSKLLQIFSEDSRKHALLIHVIKEDTDETNFWLFGHKVTIGLQIINFKAVLHLSQLC